MRLLLLSNSRDQAGRYLHHPREAMRALFGDAIRTALFVPYAGVTISWDDYLARAAAPLAAVGCTLESVHRAADPVRAVHDARAIVVGGGNTFHLLRTLYDVGLLDAIRERVRAGVPYLGWSAGAVVACPTIRTTNDMPIVEPPSLDALALVPFQINAHYTDWHPPGHQGETRAERLREFLAANPGRRVVGLPEGSMLRREGNRLELLGEAGAKLFEIRGEGVELREGDVGFLLGDGV